jgi:hypothetical protein
MGVQVHTLPALLQLRHSGCSPEHCHGAYGQRYENNGDSCFSLFSSYCGIRRMHEQRDVEHVSIALAQSAREVEHMIPQEKRSRETKWMVLY